MMPWPSDTMELASRIYHVRDHAKETREALVRDLSSVGAAPNDPRFLALRGIQVVLEAASLNAVFLARYLEHPGWWREMREGVPVFPEEHRAALEYYFVFFSSTLVFVPFVRFEHEIRRLVRAIDPAACQGGAAGFESVYRWLFKRLRTADGWVYGEVEEFMEIYRRVRNALVHTNGVSRHPKGAAADEDITWRGTVYEFREGAPLEFANDAGFVLTLITELIDLSNAIMRSPTVSSLPPIV
jgi:hypothetical protein